MKIISVEFVKAVADIDGLPNDHLPEIAFAGRSNVGKSSLINCMLNRKKLAKTSATPGKTRQLNYFRINEKIYFVDLPGYGFARVSKTEREQWRRLIEGFLQESTNLRGVVSIIDSRIGATDLDRQLLQWLKDLNRQVILVATKSDKLSRSNLNRQIQKFSRDLKEFENYTILPFSAVKGTGKKELWQAITNLTG